MERIWLIKWNSFCESNRLHTKSHAQLPSALLGKQKAEGSFSLVRIKLVVKLWYTEPLSPSFVTVFILKDVFNIYWLVNKKKRIFNIDTTQKHPHQMSRIQVVVFFFRFNFLSLCCLLHFLLGNASKTDSCCIIMEMFFQSAEGSALLSARACKPALASVLQASQVENRLRQRPIRHESGYYVWKLIFTLLSEM